jgi:hypothetical protein
LPNLRFGLVHFGRGLQCARLSVDDRVLTPGFFFILTQGGSFFRRDLLLSVRQLSNVDEDMVSCREDEFAVSPAQVPSRPGALLRSEPLRDMTLPAGMRGWRILYTTQ